MAIKKKIHRHVWYQSYCDCPHCPVGEHYVCDICGEEKEVRKAKRKK